MGVGSRGPVLDAPRARARALTPAELAWIALLPSALLGVAAILVLGPPLGRALFPPPPAAEGLWPPGWWDTQGAPDPVKLGRYLLAALAPLLLAGVVLAGGRRGPLLPPRAIRALTRAGHAAVLGLVAVAFLGQHDVIPAGRELPHIFGIGTLAAAAVLLVAALAVLRRPGVAERIARLARETAARRRASLAIAALVSATWLLQGIYTDRIAEDLGVLDWTVNDAFAVLDGRTPLLDYHLLYAKLLPYPAALALLAFGKTGFVFTLTMTALSALALIGLYAVFRRIVGSSLLALALFVPFVATSDIDHPMTLNAMWPMRYGGAYLMAWLTARHVDRRGPRRAWALFLVGGLVAINDMEFGVAATVATAAALLCARPPRSARAALALAGQVAAGALGAIALVALATLARAGALPDPAVLMEWPRIFTRLGWFSLAVPPASLHLAIYATFVAAIVLATVRLRRSDDDVLLTSMLAWSGIFGLLAGSYYIGRPDDLKLVSMFSAWSFALVLLAIAVARGLAARGWRHPTPPELLVLLGVALMACSIVRMPSPKHQIARLTRALPLASQRPAAEAFLRPRTRRGEQVAILIPMSNRIAYELGLRNISPYGTQDALVTRWQLQRVIDTVRRARADKVFLPVRRLAPQQLRMFLDAGFKVRASDGHVAELRDARRRR